MKTTEFMETVISPENFHQIYNSVLIKASDVVAIPPEVITVSGSTIGTLGNFSASTGKGKSKKTFNVCAIVASALTGRKVLNYQAAFPNSKRRVPDVGLVIIDGLRDLLFDINSSTEAAEVIGLLMRWSSQYNLHIHTVLHLNKGDDNVRGHIGTELNHKAETILQIVQNCNDSNVSEVHASLIRDRLFPPFAFKINEEGLPVLVENFETTPLKKPTFNKCMDAVDKYIEAQDLLVKYAADDSALSSYGELKTEIIDYKVWHSSLVKKMNDAQKMLSDSKIIKK